MQDTGASKAAQCPFAKMAADASGPDSSAAVAAAGAPRCPFPFILLVREALCIAPAWLLSSAFRVRVWLVVTHLTGFCSTTH